MPPAGRKLLAAEHAIVDLTLPCRTSFHMLPFRQFKHHTDHAGFTSADEGFASAGDGFTSAGEGFTSSGEGFTSLEERRGRAAARKSSDDANDKLEHLFIGMVAQVV